MCAIRTEQAAFTLLCTALELELKTELLLRPSSSNSPLVAALSALPWLSLRSSISSSASSSPSPASLIAAFGRALAPHKHAAELSKYLCSGDARPDSLFKGAMSVVPLSAQLLDEVTPLLLRLSSFAPPRLQAAVSRLCRSLLSNGRSGALFLDASQHLLRAAIVQASSVAFDSLLPVFARALKAATKDRPATDSACNDSSHPPAALRLPMPLSELPPSQRPSLCARIMRLVEATPALSAQANAHKQLTMRQRHAARSILGADEERALAELKRLAANADSLSDPPSDLKDLQDLLETNENVSATNSGRSIPPSPPPARLFDVFGTPEKGDACEVKDETKEQEKEEEADPEDLEREERDAELDRLIAAAEKFRGFDLAALAAATASLQALNA